MTNIGYRAFDRCKGLSSLSLPDTLTIVSSYAFANCSGLKSLAFPDSLASISSEAFAYCEALTSLSLPHSLVNVGCWAFRDCTNLTSVSFRPRLPATFIAWAVGNMRNRDNWQVTSVKRLRNVLGLITAFGFERRHASSVDPRGEKGVFQSCNSLNLN